MLIEVLCRDADGRQFFQNYVHICDSAAAASAVEALTVDCVMPGDQIEVTATDGEKVVGRWQARNAYPATVVTVTVEENRITSVTDDLSNTYVSVPDVAMTDVPMDHIPHTNC